MTPAPTNTLAVNDHVAVLDPDDRFVHGARDGTRMSVRAAPGCWGPMITPELPSGHEVSRPIHIDDAEPGATIALWVRGLGQISSATTSGTGRLVEAFRAQYPNALVWFRIPREACT